MVYCTFLLPQAFMKKKKSFTINCHLDTIQGHVTLGSCCVKWYITIVQSLYMDSGIIKNQIDALISSAHGKPT